MLKEHQQGRDAVLKMKTALVRNRDGDRGAARDFVNHARAYIALLSHHIDKENNVLFALADSNLSQEKQMALWEGFERIEKQKIGPGKHEAFHKMIASLESIYLS
jgi:hemerythrin-like domain-containing protein